MSNGAPRPPSMASNLADVAVQAYERGLTVGYERARRELSMMHTAALFAPTPSGAPSQNETDALASSPPTQSARRRSNTITRAVATPPPDVAAPPGTTLPTAATAPPADTVNLEASMIALHLGDSASSTPRSQDAGPAPEAKGASCRPSTVLTQAAAKVRNGALPVSCSWADQSGPEQTICTDEATLRAVVAPPAGKKQGKTVTEMVKNASRCASGMTYDNTRVASLVPAVLSRLGIRELDPVDMPYTNQPNEISPIHDHMVAGLATLSGLDLVVLGAEIKIAHRLPSGQSVRGSIDLVVRSTASGSLVPIELKTSGQLSAGDWYKDVMRRTYIQQAMLYALLLEKRTGQRPRECVVLAGPSANSKIAPGQARIYRYAVAYNPRLWLTDEINKCLDCFRRFGGEETVQCGAILAAKDIDDE